MHTNRNNFYRYLAPTSLNPIGLEIAHAEGIYLTDTSGKKYIDLISGISVSNTGHRHPAILLAMREQLDKHLHLMVYGEMIQQAQTELASALCNLLPPSLNSVYFVNSGSEAVEGALKLAKRSTGRHEMIAFKKAYHGSTHGALSVMGDEALKIRFRPLLPSVQFLEFNNVSDLKYITKSAACVIIEPVQGEAGVVVADPDFLVALGSRCHETGTLLIFDEIQTGMGRTGSMFAFQKSEIVPDVLLLAKALGGGMPLGAFIASRELMVTLSENPSLGHITTFGGHPLSCAAALANLKVIIHEKLAEEAEGKSNIFKDILMSLSPVKEIRASGLLMAIQFESEAFTQSVISKCLQKGVLTDWFLFRPDALRIAPPLTITREECETAATLVKEAIAES